MKKGEILKSGDVVLPAPTSLSVADEIIWTSDTGRTLMGRMVGDVVAEKKNVSIKWEWLTDEEVKTIKSRLIAGFFPFTFQCVGGKVNNRAVSIREQLRNGDIVEILTQKNQTPKSDWLNFVVTSKARNKIKSFLREEQAKHTRMGREELERKLKNWKFPLTIDEAQ